MPPLDPASQPTRLECVPHKRARSAGVGKRRYVAPPFMLVISELNQTVHSVMETPHAGDVRLEDCLASMPQSVECEDRTKSRARTATGKKLPSTLSGNRRPILHLPQPFGTLSSVSPSSVSSHLTACIEYSTLDRSPSDNIGINNRQQVRSIRYPSLYPQSTATAKQSTLPS